MKTRTLFLLLLLVSCTSFINRFDEKLLKSDREITLKENLNNFCSQNSQSILLNDNKKAQNNFDSFIKNSVIKYGFVDKIVLWTLIQMKIRPDLASPNAGLQFYIKAKGFEKNYYHIFSKDQNSFALLYSLEQILKGKSRFSLKDHMNTVDSKYRYSISVSQSFSNYLMSKKLELRSNPNLSSKYLRGDENLKQGERLKNYSLSKVYTDYKRTKATYYTQSTLFDYKKEETPIKCNYNLKSYEENIYSIHNENIRGHTFGLQDGENAFLAISNLAHFDFNKQNSPYYFQGESLTKPAAFCLIKGDVSIALFSNDSRDPAQHLFHSIQYGLHNAKSITKIKQVVDHARYLVLENPKRLIFESLRSSEDHVQNLINLDIPIYNSYSLGNLSGSYQGQGLHGLFVDSRSTSYLKCN